MVYFFIILFLFFFCYDIFTLELSLNVDNNSTNIGAARQRIYLQMA